MSFLDVLSYRSSSRTSGINIRNGAEFITTYPRHPDTQKKNFDTRAHRRIFDILLNQAWNLSEGMYRDQLGTCCSTLVGAKGIGKTTSLKTFAELCRLVVSNVYVVYINYNNIFTSGSENIANKTLTEIVLQEMKKLLPDFDRDINSPQLMVSYFQARKINLMLLIDELDQLYKFVSESSRQTIHDLAFFGNQDSGCVSVLVCGSSAMMEDLITAKGASSTNITNEFPLLVGAPNLNGTKYRMKRIYASLPIDLEAVASITDKNLGLPKDKEWVRLVAFIAGSSVRTVQTLRNQEQYDEDFCYTFRDETRDTHGRVDVVGENLRKELIRSMYEKNKTLLNQLFRPPQDDLEYSRIFDRIISTDWELQFQPLTLNDVIDVWNTMVLNRLTENSDTEYLRYLLLHLSDSCWITIGDIDGYMPSSIYPFRMLDFMEQEMSERASQKIFWRKLMAFFIRAATSNPPSPGTLVRVGMAIASILGGCTTS